jgi:hypothetical protein
MRSGKPRLTVALMDIGNVGWYSNANVIDFAGLADPEWAMQMYHARGLHFYPASRLLTQQRPDVIVLVSLSMPDAQPQVWWPGAEVQIFASPVFHQEYQRVAIIAHKDFPEDPNFLHVYVRRDESGEAPPLIPPRSRARR